MILKERHAREGKERGKRKQQDGKSEAEENGRGGAARPAANPPRKKPPPRVGAQQRSEFYDRILQNRRNLKTI